jgi:hypothetical protein
LKLWHTSLTFNPEERSSLFRTEKGKYLLFSFASCILDLELSVSFSLSIYGTNYPCHFAQQQQERAHFFLSEGKCISPCRETVQ